MATEKIAVDFDGALTNIYRVGSGMVLSEPTVAAVSVETGEIKAVGAEARKLIGKTGDGLKIVFPVFEGEIVNEKVAVGILTAFLRKIGIKSRLTGVSAVISVPCGITPEMLKKYEKTAYSSGINKVRFVEAPVLSAIGQKLPLNDFSPCFLIDMAGGTTNIAALSLGGVIAGISVNFGVNKVVTDIIDYVASAYELQIGLLTAERLKNDIGSLDKNDGLATIVNGRDIKTGRPKSISLRAVDIMGAVKPYFDKIGQLAMEVLVKLPPEVSAEIRHAGVYVSGQGAGVYGLKDYFSEQFAMQVNVAENPDMSVALGGGAVVADKSLTEKLAVKIS